MTLDEMKAAHPALFAEYEKAKAESDALHAVVDPLREKRDKFIAEKLAPVEAKAKAMGEEIKGHMPRMAELDRQVSGLVKAMGG